MPLALLFLQTALAIQGLLWLIYILGIVSISVRGIIGVLTKYSTESVDSLGYMDISTIKVFQSTDMDVFPFIYVFNVFHQLL